MATKPNIEEAILALASRPTPAQALPGDRFLVGILVGTFAALLGCLLGMLVWCERRGKEEAWCTQGMGRWEGVA